MPPVLKPPPRRSAFPCSRSVWPAPFAENLIKGALHVYFVSTHRYDLGLISGAIHYIVDDLAECGQADDVVLNVTLAPVLATTSFAFFNDTDGGSGDDGSVHECMSTTAGIIISAAKIGAVVGTFVAGSLMNVGRRTAIGINCGIFVAGPVIMALSETVPVIVVGRFVVGLGVGIGAVVSPAYMSEMSPAVVRGRVVMLYQVFLGIGEYPHCSARVLFLV